MEKKVLFVVYRPEWWGCFDELYREMQKQNIRCFVLPVPYYERDSQDYHVLLEKVHYAPDLLPEYVNWEDYRTFSLEGRYFDEIYIHNPYDGNYVGDTVLPVYYSEQLKAYTRKLIYVPHLIFRKYIPEDYKFLPVYEHVNAIWLADERARYALEVAYDSKIEIVPERLSFYLKRLAQKNMEKGKGKKLLFSITAHDLCYDTERFVRKAEQLLDYLKFRDEISVILRTDEDIPPKRQSISGDVWQLYERLLQKYRTEKIGTYEPDKPIYEAVVEADGLLCRPGNPLEELFFVQGKLVLNFDLEMRAIPTKEDLCITDIWGAAIDGDNVWFTTDKTKLLCKMNLKLGELEEIIDIPDEVDCIQNFIEVKQNKDILYLIPHISDGIWEYDLCRKCFRKIYFPNSTFYNVVKAVKYQHYLYMAPGDYPGILSYNMKTGEIIVYDSWVTELERYILPQNLGKSYFSKAIRQSGNMLYMASSQGDVWLEFNMDDGEAVVRPMQMKGFSTTDMETEGEECWLAELWNGQVVKWNKNTAQAKVLYSIPKQELYGIAFSRLHIQGEYVYVYPLMHTEILQIHKTKNIVRHINIAEVFAASEPVTPYLREYNVCFEWLEELDNGIIVAYEKYDGSFVFLDYEMKLLHKVSCRLPYERVMQKYRDIWRHAFIKDNGQLALSEEWSFPVELDYFLNN